jgi:hypothetical protein
MIKTAAFTTTLPIKQLTSGDEHRQGYLQLPYQIASHAGSSVHGRLRSMPVAGVSSCGLP